MTCKYIYIHLYTFIYTYIYIYIYVYIYIDSRKPPPARGISYLAGSLTKNPEEEDPPRSTWYKFFVGGPLPPGSCVGNLPNKKHPSGGGGPAINIHICIFICIYMYTYITCWHALAPTRALSLFGALLLTRALSLSLSLFPALCYFLSPTHTHMCIQQHPQLRQLCTHRIVLREVSGGEGVDGVQA